MSPLVHRAVRLVCLAGAAPAPLVTALFCRELARYAVKHALPRSGVEALPALTELWIVKVAEGALPLPLIGLLISLGMGVSGCYSIFSKRLTAETGGSTLLLVCCVSYATALTTLGSSLAALLLPFHTSRHKLTPLMSDYKATITWKRTSAEFLKGKYSREHTWAFGRS